MSGIEPSAEQQAIIAHEPSAGELVAVRAYAGCAKTTTIRMLAEAHPHLSFIYVCFNNSVAQEAGRRFPRNVVCRTMHSFAYREIVPRYPKGKIGNALRVKEIADLLSVPPVIAFWVRETLGNWLVSSDSKITTAHARGAGDDVDLVVEKARSLWRRMTDPQSPTPLSHDGYLKMFCLEEADLPQCDVILLDEAQDTNPVVAYYLLQQREKGRALVLVGDPHQSIYAFRGAINAMERFAGQSENVTHFGLTTSYRITHDTAHLASLLLNRMKNDPVAIKGFKANSQGDPASSVILARTNAELIRQAHFLVQKGLRLHWAGTERLNHDPFQGYGFGDILDAYHLYAQTPGMIRSPYFQRFSSFRELEDLAEGENDGDTADQEIRKIVNIVKEWKHELPAVLQSIRQASAAPEHAHVGLSTAHKAKGLEWDSVRLCDDFLNLNDHEKMQEMTSGEIAQEVNLLYVAITRSAGRLQLNPSLEAWFGNQPTFVETEPAMRKASC
jgi:hypothetical protein